MPRSALTAGSAGEKLRSSAMSSPRMRRSILPMLLTASFKSMNWGWSTCFAAEGEELPGEFGGAAGGLRDFLQRLGDLGAELLAASRMPACP